MPKWDGVLVVVVPFLFLTACSGGGVVSPPQAPLTPPHPTPNPTPPPQSGILARIT